MVAPAVDPTALSSTSPILINLPSIVRRPLADCRLAGRSVVRSCDATIVAPSPLIAVALRRRRFDVLLIRPTTDFSAFPAPQYRRNRLMLCRSDAWSGGIVLLLRGSQCVCVCVCAFCEFGERRLPARFALICSSCGRRVAMDREQW